MIQPGSGKRRGWCWVTATPTHKFQESMVVTFSLGTEADLALVFTSLRDGVNLVFGKSSCVHSYQGRF